MSQTDVLDLDWLMAAQENSGEHFLLARSDYDRIRLLVDAWPSPDHPVRRLLATKLWRGLVCHSDEALQDIVTLGSAIEYRRKARGELERAVLVDPDHRPAPDKAMAVTSPFGALLLGLREGHRIQQTAPDGSPFHLEIARVRQPEMAAP